MNIILHKFMHLPKPKKWIIASGLTFATASLILYFVKIRRGKKKVSYKPANQLIRDEFVEFDVNRVQKSDNPTNASPVDLQFHLSQLAQPKLMELIKQLLDNSSRKRNVNENYKNYLIEILDLKDLQNYYSLKKLEIKKKIEKYCNKMIHVRGDGNCFYTSFGYQLLRIVIYQYSDEEFEAFLKKNFSIPFKIQLKNEILENAEKQRILLNYYKDRIIYIRNLEKYYKQNENYSSELMRHFRAHEHKDDLDGYFQPLTTLFLRNLCMDIVEKCEEGQNVLDKENLLIWEEECNSNEQVIAILAKYFQLHIQLIFLKNEDFQILEYSKEYSNQNRTIILLIQPGHYNIGLKN